MDNSNTRNKINKLLSICPNYEKINSYDFFEGDIFSETMINFYLKLIDNINMDDEDEITFLNKLDSSLAKYVDDYRFRKYLKTKLLEVDHNERYYTYKITMKLIENSNIYKSGVVEIAKWI